MNTRWLLLMAGLAWLAVMLLLLVSLPRAEASGRPPPPPPNASSHDDWGSDEWAHVGAMTVCSFAGAHLVHVVRTQPTHQFPQHLNWQDRLVAGVGCFGLGLAKEYLIDDKPSSRDLGANAAGVAVGLSLTWVW